MTCVSSTPSMTNGIDATKGCGHSARHRDLRGHGWTQDQTSVFGARRVRARCRLSVLPMVNKVTTPTWMSRTKGVVAVGSVAETVLG